MKISTSTSSTTTSESELASVALNMLKKTADLMANGHRWAERVSWPPAVNENLKHRAHMIIFRILISYYEGKSVVNAGHMIM